MPLLYLLFVLIVRIFQFVFIPIIVLGLMFGLVTEAYERGGVLLALGAIIFEIFIIFILATVAKSDD